MQSEQIFKKILVPTDGSLPSLVAQELTAFMAKKLSSKVTVINIVAHELMIPQKDIDMFLWLDFPSKDTFLHLLSPLYPRRLPVRSPIGITKKG